MQRLSAKRAAIVILVTFAAAGTLSGAARSPYVQAQRVVPSGISDPRGSSIRSACAVLGSYHIGPSITAQSGTTSGPITPTASSLSSGPATPITSSGPVRRHHGVAVAIWPGWSMHGTLTLSGYSGCSQGSQPTAGAFSVTRGMVGPLIERPRSRSQSTTIACPMYGPCGFPYTGIISATGSFTQDATHGDDPLYVVVSATITTTRPGPALGLPCSVQKGCPPTTVITSTVTMTNVTGYLQATASDSQRIVLSFLPPPAPTGDIAPTPLLLYGWRGVRPALAPQP